MGIKSNSSIKKTGMKIAFIVVLLTIMLIIFNVSINNIFDKLIKDELDNLIYQKQILVERDLGTIRNDVSLIADSVATLGNDIEGILNFNRYQEEFTDFNEIYYLNNNGVGTTSSGKPIDLSNTDMLEEVLDGKISSMISENPEAIYSDDVIVAAPVISNGNITGIVAGKYSFETIMKQISALLGEEGIALIVDVNGNPIAATINNSEEILMLENATISEEGSVKDILQDYSQRETGIVEFVVEGNENIAVYKPLSLGNWNLVIISDEDSEYQKMSDIAIIVSIVSILIFFVIVYFIIHTVTSKRSSIRKIEKIAYYDELTGLRNLEKLKLDMREVLEKNPHTEYVVLKLDVENLKVINEMYGFDVGNEAIKTFKIMVDSWNESSLMVARVGIDEFILFSKKEFLGNVENKLEINEIRYKKLIPALENHNLRFKYGRYFVEKGEGDVDEIINKLTLAHSIAKGSKDITLCDYDEEFKKQTIKLAEISNKMEAALENKEFVPYIQPKFSTEDGSLIGGEALVRWIEIDGKMIYPDTFIPLFENNGFVCKIDKYMLKSVCDLIKGWIEKGYNVVPISVNFSRVHLQNSDFVEELLEIIDRSGILRNLIEIEITESSLVENEVAIEKVIKELNCANVSVAIDDFGAGYSSLGLLKDLEIDTIKLDRSFLTSKNSDGKEGLVIQGVAQLVHTLKINLIAEGVEDKEQLQLLRDVGCQGVQGYYFAKPMPVEEYEEKYLKNQN